MKNFKYYVSIAMIIGFILSVNSSSFAEERFDINIDQLKAAVQENIWDNNTHIIWNAKVKNHTDQTQTYAIKVNFLNSDNEKIREATRIATVKPNEAKDINCNLALSQSLVKSINSGYVLISKVEEKVDSKEQVLTAKLNKNIDASINRLSSNSVELAYSVKLTNNTDKAVTRNVTVAFLDAYNNYVGSETKTATFSAGESKLISDTMVLKAGDAGRIAASNVTIN